MIALFKQYKLIAAGVALALALAVGWAVNGWRLAAAISDLNAEHAAYREAISREYAAKLVALSDEQKALQDRLASLDATSTEKLTDAQQENERLRRLYGAADNERKRLRIEVRVARADAVVSETTSAGSVGDATSVELSAAAGQSVWDIRAGMIEDKAKLEYLQGYVRSLTR